MAVCQNLVPLVNIKIAGKWMFIPLKMVLIGIDPYPYIPKPIGATRSPMGIPASGDRFYSIVERRTVAESTREYPVDIPIIPLYQHTHISVIMPLTILTAPPKQSYL